MIIPVPGQEAPVTFARDGWSFEADARPLWGTDRIDDLTRERKNCKIPDMFCGGAALRIRHEASGILLELGADDALRCCTWAPPAPAPLHPPRGNGATEDGPLLGTVKCRMAGQWRPQSANPDIKEIEVTSDWTCSTPYWGSIYTPTRNSGENAANESDNSIGGERQLDHSMEQETDEELPMDLLRQRDEIVWYQEILLWEDELADNGLCRMSIRVRVMPTFWFVLLICEMRCDGVLLREVGTRFFCRFGSDRVLREWTWKEASFDALRNRGADLDNSPHISQTSIGTVQLLAPTDVQRQLRHVIVLGGAT